VQVLQIYRVFGRCISMAQKESKAHEQA
jgi:hypothetical protein